MFRNPLFESAARFGSSALTCRVNCSGINNALSGFARSFRGADFAHESSVWRNLGRKIGLVNTQGNIAEQYLLYSKNSIHSGTKCEAEAQIPFRSSEFVQGLVQDKGGRSSGSMKFVQGLLRDRGNYVSTGRSSSHPRPLEANADVVHIKLMRNNAFVTLTDSKGNRKVGISAGQVAGKGTKLTRYSGEAAAENIGRRVRQMKTRSVVVKVNGYCMFRRKKESILSFKDGYSNSRLDVNPVVYIEDTTRKPHNGCRLPKRRRI